MVKEQHLIDGEDSWSFGNDYGREVVIFGVDNIHHLILIIRKITFQYQVKDQLMLLMKKKKEKKNRNKTKLTLVKQIQNFAWVCITMMMRVSYM